MNELELEARRIAEMILYGASDDLVAESVDPYFSDEDASKIIDMVRRATVIVG